MPNYRSLFSTSFNKGLVTEAGDLNFPENASVDELNCTLERTGNRRRRLGVKVDDSTSASSETYTAGQVVTTLTWENVGGDASVEFAVVQIGSYLRFYDKSYEALSNGEVPISSTNDTPYVLNMAAYNRPGGTGAASANIQVASVKGRLVVASPEINTFYIERDEDDLSFSVTEIDFYARDYEWLGDTSTYYEIETRNPSDLNWLREYDTRNAGWGRDDDGTSPNFSGKSPLMQKYDTDNQYPALNIPWHSAKDSNDDFSLSTFKKLSNELSTSLINNGHFILDLYTGDRSVNFTDNPSDFPLVDIQANVPNKTENTRFASVAAYAGRVFYAGMTSERNSSRVYYSQTLASIDNIGKCHSFNDPTSETFSDRLDTDGGYIDIEEAYGIRYLYAHKNVLFIFASNGVWALDGVDGVFRSTEYRLSKISEVGIAAGSSFGSLDGAPFWWGTSGIYTIASNDIVGVQVQDLSQQSIQSFWADIADTEKEQVITVVDDVEKKVFWFYPKSGETTTGKFNRVLVFDAVLQAFYPWEVEDKVSSNSYIIGTSFYGYASGQPVFTQVVDDDGNDVIDGTDTVGATINTLIDGSGTQLKVLIFHTTDGSIQWGAFSGTDFLDWGSEDYSSFAESRHDMMGDMNLRKQAPYLVTYMGVTEEGWETADNITYTPIREGSCLVSAYWDWKTVSASGTQQAYRLKSNPTVDTGDLTDFDYPFTVNQTRVRMRGRGRSLRVRFESEQGKDFNIVGWGLVGALNDRF